MNKNIKKIIGMASIVMLLGLGCTTNKEKKNVPPPQNAPAAANTTKTTANTPPAPILTAEQIQKSKEEADYIKALYAPDYSDTKIIKMIAKQFSFEPSTITVKQNEKVMLDISTSDVSHTFTILELNISEAINLGEPRQIPIDTSKKGKYNFFCNIICGEGHDNMNGTLIIE